MKKTSLSMIALLASIAAPTSVAERMRVRLDGEVQHGALPNRPKQSKEAAKQKRRNRKRRGW